MAMAGRETPGQEELQWGVHDSIQEKKPTDTSTSYRINSRNTTIMYNINPTNPSMLYRSHLGKTSVKSMCPPAYLQYS